MRKGEGKCAVSQRPQGVTWATSVLVCRPHLIQDLGACFESTVSLAASGIDRQAFVFQPISAEIVAGILWDMEYIEVFSMMHSAPQPGGIAVGVLGVLLQQARARDMLSAFMTSWFLLCHL